MSSYSDLSCISTSARENVTTMRELGLARRHLRRENGDHPVGKYPGSAATHAGACEILHAANPTVQQRTI